MINHKTNISAIFSPRKHFFAVPNYQRAYSWEVGADEDKQVPQFLEDLKNHPEAVPQYHLGHFLFEQDPTDNNKFWIVDGQQRMTTLVIFMACVYKRLANTEGYAIDAQTLYADYLYTAAGLQKFRTVDYDNNYFENVVIMGTGDEETTKSRKRIAVCKEYLQKEIDHADIRDVLRWKDLAENAKITTDTIEDKAEATQVFTFQNDRGKELSNLEKLKAFLMLQVYLSSRTSGTGPEDSIRYIEKEFETIYECLEELEIADEDQVFNYHVTAFMALAGTAMERVKNGFGKVPVDERQKWLKDFCLNLKRSFQKILDIQDLLHQPGYVADIIYLDQTNALPLLLKLFHSHSNAPELEKTFRLIEIILFRCKYTTANYYTNLLPNEALEYQGHLDALNDKLLNYSQKGFKWYWRFENDFHQYLNGGNHYFNLSRYLLWKYENKLRSEVKEPPMLYPEFTNLYGATKFENTIDHWAPQKPDGVEYDEEFINHYLHNIGNMVLATRSRNASDNNKLPGDRGTFSVLISRQKLEPLKNNWGKEHIKNRQREIVNFAIGYWNPDAITS